MTIFLHKEEVGMLYLMAFLCICKVLSGIVYFWEVLDSMKPSWEENRREQLPWLPAG
jgi:hypothetical protein